MDRRNFLRGLCGIVLLAPALCAQNIIPYTGPTNPVQDSRELQRNMGNGEFNYTLSADRTSGHLYLNANKLGALDLGFEVKLSGFDRFWSLIKTGKPIYRKTASFSYETDSEYMEKIDEGTNEEEIYRYGLKDGNWILEKYNGSNPKKKNLEGNVLHGQPLVHLINKKYSGEDIDYNIQTFLLGLKYKLKIERREQNGVFEQVSFNPASSALWEDGKWKSLSKAPGIIFGNITADFNKNIVKMAVAELYNGKTLMVILNGSED